MRKPIYGRPDPHEPAPVTGMRGTVWLVALLLLGLAMVTALTGAAPEITEPTTQETGAPD